MSDLEQARKMLMLSKRDLKVLRNMLDSDKFPDEVFGFHAQQAVEKALKSWLNLVGIVHPRIHDLRKLFIMLQKNGQIVPENFLQLVDFTDFATEFRYEFLEEIDSELDRQTIICEVTKIVDHVESLMRQHD